MRWRPVIRANAHRDLKSGFPADDGRALEYEEEISIDFEDRPPYVGFKGAGVILPRLEADGLPIETVNVDQVKIAVSRVNDRALFRKRIGQGETVSQGSYSYTYGEESPSDSSTEIWDGVMDIARIQNSPVVTVFPLGDVIGDLEPGAYYVNVSDARELNRRDGPAASANRWIMMTDLALTAYRGEHGLDVTLRSLLTGRALPSAKVQLVARNNEILAFDTDLIGSYGICIDISRTWWIGDRAPRADMVSAMQHAHEHIMTNMALLAPGVRIEEMIQKLHRLDDKYQARKYGCAMHGVGLCDEWPHVDYPDKSIPGSFDYELQPGMVLCVEALVGEEGGDFSIKLEDQVLITEDGFENLTTYPFDAALMGNA